MIRHGLLQQCSNALRATHNEALPPRVRDQFKRAAELAEVALGIDDAARRKGLVLHRPQPPSGYPPA
jgi:hypothetical protein